ncbi:hypothetical protein BD310DRAFT_940466 [Dichomitus squalens]|uniref:Uncharacterized protein n=1 Tax=Dichomitus squalens TaxID=114155 RepID=A0A4Q9PE31_9APHY|nr:hypothetical protein BD310DRAFT_940466 [Dichomitus squalens]
MPVCTSRRTNGICRARRRNLRSDSDVAHDSYLVRDLSALPHYVYSSIAPRRGRLPYIQVAAHHDPGDCPPHKCQSVSYHCVSCRRVKPFPSSSGWRRILQTSPA